MTLAYKLLPEPAFPPMRALPDLPMGSGYDPRYFIRTASRLYVVDVNHAYRILVRGHPHAVVYTSDDRDAVNWMDFTLELIVGIIGLALGLTIGRRGYKALKPLITRLWVYPAFQEHVQTAMRWPPAGRSPTCGIICGPTIVATWSPVSGRLSGKNSLSVHC